MELERSVAGILHRAGKVFVARRPPGGVLGDLWEFPGGKVEPGESEEQALAREFDEEFGAKVRAIRRLGQTEFRARRGPRLLCAWEIELLPGSSLVPSEHRELRWAAAGELASMALADSDRGLLPFIDELTTANRG